MGCNWRDVKPPHPFKIFEVYEYRKVEGHPILPGWHGAGHSG